MLVFALVATLAQVLLILSADFVDGDLGFGALRAWVVGSVTVLKLDARDGEFVVFVLLNSPICASHIGTVCIGEIARLIALLELLGKKFVVVGS